MRQVVCVFVLAFLYATTASAGSTTAKINMILIYEAAGQGIVYVYPVGGVNNAPGCHGSNGDYYSFDRLDD